MKKLCLFTTAIAAVALCGCVNSNTDLSESNIAEVNSQIDKYLPNKVQSVAPQAGQVCVVRVGNDTLAVTDVASDVVVPKSLTPTIEYLNKSNMPTRAAENAGALDNKEQLWNVIAFEDSKKGDYDYNDLIIHVKYILKNGTFSLFIQPVAYGASKTINLGCEIYYDGQEVQNYSWTNVRSSLFKDSGKGFINTEKYDRHYSGYTDFITFPCKDKKLAKFSVAWYIVVDGSTKIYAVNKEMAKTVDMFDANKYPYALVLSGTNSGHTQSGVSGTVGGDWFRYPLERKSIFNCYDIESWINAGDMLENHIKDSSLIFDVEQTSTKLPMRVYELPKSLGLVTTWDE